ncbi:sensor domain-containing protein [Streptomyces sp. NPDC048518]|uniref:sensor histidine kinase n=1 Tax=Streptomyces sp. NPDC048518 TaxID=3155029 RepID=UPI0033E4C155
MFRGKFAWPWRSAVYLLTGALLGATVLVLALALTTAGLALTLLLIGLPLLAAIPLSGLPVAALERRRLHLLDPAAPPPATPHRTPTTPGIPAWLHLRLKEQATWRELAYTALLALVLWPLDLLVLACTVVLPALLLVAPAHLALAPGHGGVRPAKLWVVDSYPEAAGTALLGLALLLLLAYPLRAYAAPRAALTRFFLAPREAELADILAEVTRSRARLVDAFEAERRRIERDLHDGAQQRLVALTMTLGLARLDAPPEGPLADRLATAHDEAGRVLAELRELIHGIHPQVLADHGLTAAIEDIADRSAIPVRTDRENTEDDSNHSAHNAHNNPSHNPNRPPLPRFPRAIESAAHFAVRELLANVGKHSGATHARVTATHTTTHTTTTHTTTTHTSAHGVLRIEVHDDGRGGADPARGTGLTGLADRLAVLDGTLTVASPQGGPTTVSVEIPVEVPVESPCPAGN